MCKDSSAKFYQDKIERIEKRSREQFQSLPKEKKEKKPQYGC